MARSNLIPPESFCKSNSLYSLSRIVNHSIWEVSGLEDLPSTLSQTGAPTLESSNEQEHGSCQSLWFLCCQQKAGPSVLNCPPFNAYVGGHDRAPHGQYQYKQILHIIPLCRAFCSHIAQQPLHLALRASGHCRYLPAERNNSAKRGAVTCMQYCISTLLRPVLPIRSLK
jgi:hypothetical protein